MQDFFSHAVGKESRVSALMSRFANGKYGDRILEPFDKRLHPAGRLANFLVDHFLGTAQQASAMPTSEQGGEYQIVLLACRLRSTGSSSPSWFAFARCRCS